MTHEGIPLQYDLFTGSLVDNRTREQKAYDRERDKPVQMLMFSQRDIAQIGVSPTPRMDLSPGRLVLIREDPRTDEERERDLMKEAESQTTPMFEAAPQAVKPAVQPEDNLLISGSAEYRVTLFEFGKDELREIRPDVADMVQQLKDTDIEAIALQAEEALKEVYKMVLGITLTAYLAKTEVPLKQVSNGIRKTVF
jgi:hypothetical protein